MAVLGQFGHNIAPDLRTNYKGPSEIYVGEVGKTNRRLAPLIPQRLYRMSTCKNGFNAAVIKDRIRYRWM